MKKTKIRIGVSINQQEEEPVLKPTLGLESLDLAEETTRKSNNQIHAENEFQTKWLTLDELKETMEQSAYLVIPRANKVLYGPPKVADFEDTYIIPFDVDDADYSLEEFLQRISPKYMPTFSFKTQSNDDEKPMFRYRLIYVFKEPFKKLEDYYIFYHYMLGLIEIAAGEFDDGYAYGLNPDSPASLKGFVCKSVRCVHQGEIQFSGRVYSKGIILSASQLEILKELEEHSIKIVEKLKENKEIEKKLSSELHNYIINNNYTEIKKLHSRKIYMTSSFFKNGFAQVRGNDMFMMLIRKFKWEYGMYKQVKWEVGEKRKKKLKCDISLMRAIDFIDNGEETFTPDELYVAVFKEMLRSFKYIDRKDGDTITLKNLEDWVNENLEIPITDIIEHCQEINHNFDSGKIGRKRCISPNNGYAPTFIKGRLRPRVICESKGNWFPSYIDRRVRKHIGRAVNRFDQLISAYDPNKSLKENVDIIENKNILGMVGYHKGSLEKFIRTAKEVDGLIQIIKEEKTSYNPSDRGNLFKEGWHTCEYGDYSDPIFNIAKWIEEDCGKEEKLKLILEKYESNKCSSKEYIDKYWVDVRSGKVSKPKSGRPRSEWQSHFDVESILDMRAKDLITMVKEQFPNVKDNTIRVWQRNMKKKSTHRS